MCLLSNNLRRDTSDESVWGLTILNHREMVKNHILTFTRGVSPKLFESMYSHELFTDF